MKLQKQLAYLAGMAILTLLAVAPAFALVKATEGVVTRVDSKTKEIAIKTADGTEEVFKFTGRTAMHAAHGTKAGAVDTYMAGKEGTHVVVHYTEEGGKKTATGIDDLGKDTVKVSKGSVVKTDEAAHTITVKTEDGSEETYHVAKDAAVDSGHGVEKGSEYAAKNGEKVTVHYTEEGGKKVAHFIKSL